jgi:hypothetical protein
MCICRTLVNLVSSIEKVEDESIIFVYDFDMPELVADDDYLGMPELVADDDIPELVVDNDIPKLVADDDIPELIMDVRNDENIIEPEVTNNLKISQMIYDIEEIVKFNT